MKLRELLSVVDDQIKTEVRFGMHDIEIPDVIACQDNEVKCVTIKDDVLYIELYLDVEIPGGCYESIRNHEAIGSDEW